MAVLKKRYWAFVLYLDSAPDDWQQQLIDTGLPFTISPYHDQDLDPNGDKKKPHYHVILCYSGPTTFNAVSSLTSRLNQPIPIALESIIGYFRYFTHMDNPDKFQYDPAYIKCFNGFNIRDIIEITKSEVLRIKRELLSVIREYSFTEYSEFCNYVFDNMTSDYFDVASNHTIFFNTYLKSVRYSCN